MRHRKSFNHLSRKSGHRRAMLGNMASSLIKHKKIQTTTAKAKALRSFVEPSITKSKNDTTHSRRLVFSYLRDKEAVAELFRDVSAKVSDRPGGYTRILKIGNRLGDNADMCIIELVDYNENLLAAKSESAASGKRRRRRGGKKKAEEGALQTQPDAEIQSDDASELVEDSTDSNVEVASTDKDDTSADASKEETAENKAQVSEAKSTEDKVKTENTEEEVSEVSDEVKEELAEKAEAKEEPKKNADTSEKKGADEENEKPKAKADESKEVSDNTKSETEKEKGDEEKKE